MRRTAAVVGVGHSDWVRDWTRVRNGERPADAYGACRTGWSGRPSPAAARSCPGRSSTAKYLAAYLPPYNVIAVALEEGPIVISNLAGAVPADSWIGRSVAMVYIDMPDGFVLPRLTLT